MVEKEGLKKKKKKKSTEGCMLSVVDILFVQSSWVSIVKGGGVGA